MMNDHMFEICLNDDSSHCLSFFFDSISNVKKRIWSMLETGYDNCTKEEFKLNTFTQTKPYKDSRRAINIKCLIWQPSSVDLDVVVFINNQSEGWYSFVNEYNEKYKTKTVYVAFSGKKSEYPLYVFEYSNKNYKRTLQVIKYVDGKWEFFSSGKVMGFEDSRAYRKRSISDRLNNEIIESYLRKLGLDLMADGFWKSKGKAIDFLVDFRRK